MTAESDAASTGGRLSAPVTALRRRTARFLGREEVEALQQRVTALEEQIDELRQHNLRLAEITDVVQELLVPLASRDQARVDKAIEKFSTSL